MAIRATPWWLMAELTPEQRAALWKAGKLDVDHLNQTGVVRKPSKPIEEIKTGPRGGKYRINSNGRKSYDVP